MMVYEKNTHSRIRSFLYIERFWGFFSLATPYMGAKVWYVFRLAGIYTRIPDIYTVVHIIVIL